MDSKEVINMLDAKLDDHLNFTGSAGSPSFTTATSGAGSSFTVTADSGTSTGAGSYTIGAGTTGTCTTAYTYWTDYYYPTIIRESYPIYIRERAEDKGRQAYEVIKHLQDHKLMNLVTVKDFIEAMDILLKIL